MIEYLKHVEELEDKLNAMARGGQEENTVDAVIGYLKNNHIILKEIKEQFEKMRVTAVGGVTFKPADIDTLDRIIGGAYYHE